MINKFKSFIEEKNLCNNKEDIMLAISGGIDSVVMCDLFYKSDYTCIILHCNFGLRDEESDADEAYVRSLAASYDFPIFVKRFETAEYAEENGISIQMAARNLRYTWFKDISDKQGINYIATAHNMNDSVETTLLNLSRGTGIKGLTGIPVINGKYIRPLLFSSRYEILEYGRTNNLQFREDSSNASKKYKRNKIRHDLIPLFEEINPSFIQTMNDNIKRFEEAHQIYRKEVLKQRDLIFNYRDNYIEIHIRDLTGLHPLSSWLYELFSDYGFSMDQCLNIERIIHSKSGKQFISPTHRLYKDRERFLLYKNEELSFNRYYIDSPDSKAVLPFPMDIEIIDRYEMDDFPPENTIACLDLEKLNFPLTIRRWQHGDYFFPLGMEQMKKVSDFFIDNKVPVPEKSKTWILCSGKNIVWIMGQRIDNRYKISSATINILKLQIYE